MPCVAVPIPSPFPTLPAPLTLPIPDPPLPPDINFCCQTPPLPIDIDPIVLPPKTVNPAFVALINKYIGIFNAYLDESLTIECPKE